MTYDNRNFYIEGGGVDPVEPKELKVINPATEEPAGVISMGSSKDVDRAVMAARRAFDGYSRSSPAERLALMERILAAYKAHYDEIARAISIEMGAPITLSKGSQTGVGVGHISAMIDVLKTFKFEEMHGTVRLVQEAVGVCALITPTASCTRRTVPCISSNLKVFNTSIMALMWPTPTPVCEPFDRVMGAPISMEIARAISS